MNLQGLKINFLGDSITEGVGVSSKEFLYHAVLKKETGLYAARNYGISGTTIALQKGTESRPKDNWADINSFCERFEKMDDDADIIVVFGGTNDYGHGDAPLGEFSDRTPSTFYGACHFLFRGLTDKYPGKPIIVMTPLHRAAETNKRGENKEKDFGMLKEYVRIIRETAEYWSLPVLDLYATSGIQPESDIMRSRYIPDGLHPNDCGHAVIAQMLKKFLQQM